MALAKYSPEAAKGLVGTGLAEREAYLRKSLEGTGTVLEAFYFVEGGEWDLVLIGDGQIHDAGFLATYLNNQGAGLYDNFRSYRLHTGAEVDDALNQGQPPLKMPGED
jgi:uncharacterized protein with GYD domain